MKLTPMIELPRQAEAAIKFYEATLGAKCGTLMRCKDFPEKKHEADAADLVLYSEVAIGSTKLMIIDNPEPVKVECLSTSQMELSIGTTSQKETISMYEGLRQSGQVLMPLQKQFWGAIYCRVCDKFGVNWSLNYELQPDEELDAFFAKAPSPNKPKVEKEELRQKQAAIPSEVDKASVQTNPSVSPTKEETVKASEVRKESAVKEQKTD